MRRKIRDTRDFTFKMLVRLGYLLLLDKQKKHTNILGDNLF